MSRTYKKTPYNSLRKPRGHKQARARGDRHVPPSAYEDLDYDSQTRLPYKIAAKELSRGKAVEKIAHKLKRKFGLTYRRALEIVEKEAITVRAKP